MSRRQRSTYLPYWR